jgi:hypothetical protein
MKAPHKRFVIVLDTDNPVEASVAQSKLEAFGIPCTLKGESASHLYGIMVDGLARVQILVAEDDLDLARQALKPGEVDSGEEA